MSVFFQIAAYVAWYLFDKYQNYCHNANKAGEKSANCIHAPHEITLGSEMPWFEVFYTLSLQLFAFTMTHYEGSKSRLK